LFAQEALHGAGKVVPVGKLVDDLHVTLTITREGIRVKLFPRHWNWYLIGCPLVLFW
jgi:hypothetical protein